MTDRPAIPAELKRRILVEAGHRCAIPTCRHQTTEIAHIRAFSEVREHRYENLIALCPNCHTRYDKGEIDRKAMLIYKRKLVFLSDRYSKFELNVLDYLRLNPRVVVHGPLSVKNIFDDGLIEVERELQGMEFPDGYKVVTTMLVRLTQAGRDFLSQWADVGSQEITY